MTGMIQLTQNGKRVAFRVESIAIVAEHWEEYDKTMLARLWIVGARDEDYWQVKETYEEVMAMMQEAEAARRTHGPEAA
jgi:DNA-binding protein YbaB